MIPDRRKQRHEYTDFTYWRESEQAREFQRISNLPSSSMDYRLADLENATRNHGVTLGRVAENHGRTGASEGFARHAGAELPASHVCGIRKGKGTASAMNTLAQPVELCREEPDLIDRIAEKLPPDVRADYYREMRHCRSLPENDEMLRILRAMQFLVLLIEQAPDRLGVERDRIEKLLTGTFDSLRRTFAASEEYHAELDRRLTELPGEIAKGISPEAIAGTIKENLRQQFVRSTIPETAEALAVVSTQMKKVSAEFAATAGDWGIPITGRRKKRAER